MKKYKNIGGRNVGFIVNGKTLGFESGEVRQLNDNFKEELNNMVSKIQEVKEKIVPVFVDKPKAKPKKEEIKASFTEEELYKLNKKEQVEIIKSYGMKKIPRFEKDRVNLILKQGD